MHQSHILPRPTSSVRHQCPGRATTPVSQHSPQANQQSETYPVTTNLLPLNPLPSNRQLPPQPLKAALSKLHESPIELLLELVLRLRNLPHHSIRAARARDVHALAGAHAHVAVLVVVHVDPDRAAQAAARGVQGVCGPPAAVPEVLGRVLVCDEQDGDGAVRGCRVDADGGLGEVLGGGFGEGLLEGADEVGVGGLEGVLLGVGGGLDNVSVREVRLSGCVWRSVPGRNARLGTTSGSPSRSSGCRPMSCARSQ